jgi:hypothetical protein
LTKKSGNRYFILHVWSKQKSYESDLRQNKR